MRLLCPHCRKAPRFDREVTVEGWEGVTVELRDGERVVSTDGERDVDWITAEPTNREWVRCAECDRSSRLADLVPEANFECRACGFLGASSADHDAARCPDPNLEPLFPPAVHPGQEQLVA